jgi:replication-associated recombination protein RarA
MPNRTQHGLCPWEAISSLQKFVRRGLERQAMEMAAELSFTHLALMLNRLRVMAHEDIGLANPQAVHLAKLWTEQAWDWHKAGNGAWRLALANTVLMLCRSPKSREADHFQCVVFDAIENQGFVPTVPDYALCKHTRRGKAKGRGIDHFRQDGAVLCPPPAAKDPYEDEAYACWTRQEAEGIIKRTPAATATEADGKTPSLF